MPQCNVCNEMFMEMDVLNTHLKGSDCGALFELSNKTTDRLEESIMKDGIAGTSNSKEFLERASREGGAVARAAKPHSHLSSSNEGMAEDEEMQIVKEAETRMTKESSDVDMDMSLDESPMDDQEMMEEARDEGRCASPDISGVRDAAESNEDDGNSTATASDPIPILKFATQDPPLYQPAPELLKVVVVQEESSDESLSDDFSLTEDYDSDEGEREITILPSKITPLPTSVSKATVAASSPKLPSVLPASLSIPKNDLISSKTQLPTPSPSSSASVVKKSAIPKVQPKVYNTTLSSSTFAPVKVVRKNPPTKETLIDPNKKIKVSEKPSGAVKVTPAAAAASSKAAFSKPAVGGVSKPVVAPVSKGTLVSKASSGLVPKAAGASKAAGILSKSSGLVPKAVGVSKAVGIPKSSALVPKAAGVSKAADISKSSGGVSKAVPKAATIPKAISKAAGFSKASGVSAVPSTVTAAAPKESNGLPLNSRATRSAGSLDPPEYVNPYSVLYPFSPPPKKTFVPKPKKVKEVEPLKANPEKVDVPGIIKVADGPVLKPSDAVPLSPLSKAKNDAEVAAFNASFANGAAADFIGPKEKVKAPRKKKDPSEVKPRKPKVTAGTAGATGPDGVALTGDAATVKVIKAPKKPKAPKPIIAKPIVSVLPAPPPPPPAWTDEQFEKIQALWSEHRDEKNLWSIISKELGKSKESCKAKWKKIEDAMLAEADAHAED